MLIGFLGGSDCNRNDSECGGAGQPSIESVAGCDESVYLPTALYEEYSSCYELTLSQDAHREEWDLVI